ncbi:hypothetical protein BHM03_00036204 [Ensete ventricosum]|nr:hypothetical protein BHM03_00036204 [Ensete ventricosum]
MVNVTSKYAEFSSPCIFELNICDDCGFESHQISLLQRNLSLTDLREKISAKYIPLLYLKPDGFFICIERTLPGYIAACMIDTSVQEYL